MYVAAVKFSFHDVTVVIHESVFIFHILCVCILWCGNRWIKQYDWIMNVSTKTVQCGKYIITHILSYTCVHTHSHNNHSPTHYLHVLVCPPPPSTMICRQSSSAATCTPFSLPKTNDQDSWGQPWAHLIARINVSQSHHIWHALKSTLICVMYCGEYRVYNIISANHKLWLIIDHRLEYLCT
jgi:hypothetical protein